MTTLKKKKEELNKKMTEQETNVSSQPPVPAVAQANKRKSIAPSAPSSSSLPISAPTDNGRSRSSHSHHYSLLAYSLQAAVRANDLTPGEEQQIMECWIEVEVQLHLMILM